MIRKKRAIGSSQYIWQRPDWPDWRWDAVRLTAPLAEAARARAFLEGAAQSLGDEPLKAVATELTTQETLATSAIESIRLDPAAVRSSVMRRLDLAVSKDRATVAGPQVRGLIDVLADATEDRGPLTEERLCGWHESLFPRGYSGGMPVLAGAFRGSAVPMRIVSGPAGRETLHFEAPPAAALPAGIRRFLKWFNQDSRPLPGALRACLAHLWFETLHPFEDGNGRIGRAVADLAIAQDSGSSHASARLWSVSRAFEQRHLNYYARLEAAQRGNLDVTEWLLWGIGCIGDAHRQARSVVEHVNRVTQFWLRNVTTPLNERQRKVLQRILQSSEPASHWITTRAYAKITDFPRITAARDLAQLVSHDLIEPDPKSAGRSTRYRILL